MQEILLVDLAPVTVLGFLDSSSERGKRAVQVGLRTNLGMVSERVS